MTKRKKPNEKSKTGPKGPTKLNDITVTKLEEAAALDCSISEMCFYANVSRESYYRWVKADPKLYDRLEALRNTPVFKARQELIKGFQGNPELALKYLERKAKKEFSQTHRLEHTGEDGGPIEFASVKSRLLSKINSIASRAGKKESNK